MASLTSRTSGKTDYVRPARRLIGTRYMHKGRDPKEGLDCLGLGINVYGIFAEGADEELHRLVTENVGYYGEATWRFRRDDPTHLECLEGLRLILTKYFEPVKISRIKPGDALLIRYKSKQADLGDHIGIYSGDAMMIHADFRRGVEEICLDGDELTGRKSIRNRIVAAYRRRQ